MASSPQNPESSRYLFLAKLIGAWFHQDFDSNGETLDEIIADFRESSFATDIAATRNDIVRFVEEFGQTDELLARAFERVFSPDVIAEGFDGMTTRQWLLRIADLLAL